MKALIVSDLHYRKENLRTLLARHPDTEYLLFLGDGIWDAEEEADRCPRVGFIGVKGNCDGFGFSRRGSDAPYSRTFCVDGVKLFLCHGHTFGLGHGVSVALLASAAEREGAQIALFGHTHQPYREELTVRGKTVTVFNPGSIGEPRGGSDCSYGVLTVEKDGIFVLKHAVLEDI